MTDWLPATSVLARLLQAVLAAIVAYGLLVGQYVLVVNGVLALGVTCLPAVLAWRYDHRTDPRLRLWIAVAVTVHVVGFLGPYSAQSPPLSLYDSVAHAVSGALVAGMGYAVLAALDRESAAVKLPEGFRVVFTLFLILAVGVAWEIFEFGAGTVASLLVGAEVLVQYGVSDIVYDLLFNTLAAVLVALWGTKYFSGLAALFTRLLGRSDA